MTRVKGIYQNGTIKPLETLILPDYTRVVIQIKELPQKKVIPALGLWQKAAGILKGRNMPDPVQWQKKIRQENV